MIIAVNPKIFKVLTGEIDNKVKIEDMLENSKYFNSSLEALKEV